MATRAAAAAAAATTTTTTTTATDRNRGKEGGHKRAHAGSLGALRRPAARGSVWRPGQAQPARGLGVGAGAARWAAGGERARTGTTSKHPAAAGHPRLHSTWPRRRRPREHVRAQAERVRLTQGWLRVPSLVYVVDVVVDRVQGSSGESSSGASSGASGHYRARLAHASGTHFEGRTRGTEGEPRPAVAPTRTTSGQVLVSSPN